LIGGIVDVVVVGARVVVVGSSVVGAAATNLLFDAPAEESSPATAA